MQVKKEKMKYFVCYWSCDQEKKMPLKEALENIPSNSLGMNSFQLPNKNRQSVNEYRPKVPLH